MLHACKCDLQSSFSIRVDKYRFKIYFSISIYLNVAITFEPNKCLV